jgi:hypothetical protein
MQNGGVREIEAGKLSWQVRHFQVLIRTLELG